MRKHWDAEKQAERERRALLDGLENARAEMNRAYCGFNSTNDPDLIESYVFEIKAIQARYSYLLRQVKEREGAL